MAQVSPGRLVGVQALDNAKDPGSGLGARGRPRICTQTERRRLLLDAAEAVFMSCGYHAATMDDVSRRAAMSKRTLYQVFASKADLFEALLTDRFRSLTLPVEDDGRPLAEQLTRLLHDMAWFCLAPEKIAMLRLMIAEATQSRDMATALERLGIGRGNSVLERWMAVQVARGALNPARVTGAANALFFAAVGEAHLHALLSIGDAPSRQVLDERIVGAVRLFLNDAAIGGGEA